VLELLKVFSSGFLTMLSSMGIDFAGSGASGVEVSVDVTYEPSRLGDSRSHLVVSAANAGEYVCPLFGHCIAPKPQGPILIKHNSAASVPFKNVFTAAANFTFTVDNPCFSVKPTETIGAKKTVHVNVSYKPTGVKQAKIGKLVISHPSNVSWIYYLKGDTATK
jgi:hydrocephalus-inducing protein